MTPEHAASLVAKAFEDGAGTLEGRGEDAHASLVRHSDQEFTVSLEVSREGGDWQRSLVATIDPSSPDWNLEVRIVDDEQRTVARVGEVMATPEELDGLAEAMARAGLTHLARELGMAKGLATSA